MSRVFVVQEPLAKSPKSGDIVRKFDIAPAKQYGDIIYILDWAAMNNVNDYEEVEDTIREKLINFSFSSDDYLLPTGDPSAMVMVGSIASELTGGRINLLRWNRNKYYEVVRLKYNGDSE